MKPLRVVTTGLLCGGRPGNLPVVFEPIHTERLLLRPMRPEDAVALHERRNHPEVSHYQSWELPFPLEKAQQMVADIAAMEGPVEGEWWMLSVVDPETDEALGDLALFMSNEGRTAEVGYTFDYERWGNGYAAEAVEALVAQLFVTFGVTRVSATLHPDNRPSAMVLERTGFIFEGHTRLSYWVGDDNSDDLIYGLTREDWEGWRGRPRKLPAEVRLVELTTGNRQDVLDLRTHHSQLSFVAPMSKSLSEALIPPVEDGSILVPWFRAIEADGVIVGFVMLGLPDHAEPFLWRLLIDRIHQRRGIAGAALTLVGDEVKAMGNKTYLTSWIEGRGSPGPFYIGVGFEPTGEVVHGETVARMTL